ncbi:HalOD1 output domain-containing protein [Natrinema sp. H-ect4]|uniref:HalOD1 output domain-containing protein n=1 Tax=Natrinema sp. H-ect4 TaxID=3242699 RepID=UPI0035A8DF4A
MNTTQSPSASAETSVSMTVINLVAQADGADPLETEPLYHAIDPDLLDSLPDAEGFSRLEFSYQGYTVSVADGDDGVEVSVDGSGGDLIDTEFSTSSRR